MTAADDGLVETTGPQTQLSRRGFVRASGVAVGAAATGGAGLEHATGNAEAVAPLVAAGLAAAATGGVSLGWMLGEWDPFAAESPPSGLTASALKDRVRQTVRTRKSTNASTIVDNRNIIKSGLPNTLYSEGKLAAIEALNEQKTQSEVQTAAIDAMKSYLTTIQRNFLRSWNESVNELETLKSAVVGHSGLSASNLFKIVTGKSGVVDRTASVGDQSVSLADGSSMSIRRLTVGGDAGFWSATTIDSGIYGRMSVNINVSTPVSYLSSSDWTGVWSDLQDVKTDVNNGLITWVENIYGQVQSGEIETADLMSSRELAALDSGEQAATNKAIRDLMALGVSSNEGTDVTISLEDVNATLSGKLAVAGGETTISTGTIDPTTDKYNYYFTYDVSEMSGVWNSYQTGVDGGNVTFTSEPYDEIVYLISTTAGETAELTASDFSSSTSGTTTWTASISDQVETAITEIESVEYYSTTEETKYSTVQLTKPFTVESITEGGKQVDSAQYTRSTQPHTDSNYITEEQWKQQQQKYQELIEQYEASQNSGTGAIFDPSDFGFNLGGMAIPGVATLGVGVAAVLGFLGWSQSN